ncbi:MAG TPA: prepilin-type N-terminal cleavage/methylation domain-containing protein, partial [Longimicrobiales bacterium]|nr:prepilin-type N-terminal cleavage/methylation domain-containing protein [Longimicrobiales bacterium]
MNRTMNRDGFSLIEIIIGMLIFVMGVLVLGVSTGFVGMQLQSSDLRTERSVAHQRVAERLYAEDFDAVQTRAQGDAVTVGSYGVWWNVQSLQYALKEVELISAGPAIVDGQRHATVNDTVVFR